MSVYTSHPNRFKNMISPQFSRVDSRNSVNMESIKVPKWKGSFTLKEVVTHDSHTNKIQGKGGS